MRKTDQGVKNRSHIIIAIVFGLLCAHSFCIAQNFDPILKIQSKASIGGTIDLVHGVFTNTDSTDLSAELSKEIFSIERHEILAKKALSILSDLGYDNVKLGVGDGSSGAIKQAPFDAILITAATPKIIPSAVNNERNLLVKTASKAT